MELRNSPKRTYVLVSKELPTVDPKIAKELEELRKFKQLTLRTDCTLYIFKEKEIPYGTKIE